MALSAKRSQCFLQSTFSVSSDFDPAACPQTTFPSEIRDLPISVAEATKTSEARFAKRPIMTAEQSRTSAGAVPRFGNPQVLDL